MSDRIIGAKLVAIAATCLVLCAALSHAQSMGKQYTSEPSKVNSPTPPPDSDSPNTGNEKVRIKGPAEIDAEARARGNDRHETMVIETAPRKKSTPSPEFSGSLLDAGL